jgi:PHD/YefM family antitoxin component YafN of YafNO toxin-antitoxin module
MSAHLPMTALPSWAFAGIAKCDVNLLIEHCEFETIIVTRKGRPDLVMISHDEWTKLTAAAARASRRGEVSEVEKAESTDGRKE